MSADITRTGDSLTSIEYPLIKRTGTHGLFTPKAYARLRVGRRRVEPWKRFVPAVMEPQDAGPTRSR